MTPRQERYRRLKAEGLCTGCMAPAEGQRLCQECREKARIRQQERYYFRLESGLCPLCGGIRDVEGQQSCARCVKRSGGYTKAQRRELGLCAGCGKCPPLENQSQCEPCRVKAFERSKERKASYLSQGLCSHCGQVPYEMDYKFCLTCILKSRAYKLLKDRKRWMDLKLLWEKQKGICSYTGVKMRLRQAQLDHKIPVSRGGTNDIDNLQWVMREVNVMKLNHDEKRFLALVHQIDKHCVSTGKITSDS